MQKQISWEKGLFRFYAIISFLGVVSLCIAIYHGISYHKHNSNLQRRLASEAGYIEFLSNGKTSNPSEDVRYQQRLNSAAAKQDAFFYDTSDPEAGRRELRARNLFKLYHSMNMWDGGYRAADAWDNAILYTCIFIALSVIPWGLHYLVKIIFLPIFLWVIKGFKS